MKKNNKEIIDFKEEYIETDKTIKHLKENIDLASHENEKNAETIKEIYQIIGKSQQLQTKEKENYLILKKVNEKIDDIIIPKYKGFIQLTEIDIIVGIISGIIAGIIDIVFVGSPDVVKIWEDGKNKGEKFDGSIFTKMLRKIGNNDNNLAKVLHWLSDKCKVPYDISVYKDVVTPNNHRLKSFSHDPGLGLLFAIVDIILGTTTTINNKGQLTILINDGNYPTSQKYLAVFYYFGHLLSDMCTSRGLPIPGFVLTQFFADGNDKSIAKIAEDMYVNGYDLRHLISMSSTVAVKDLIINIYLQLKKEKGIYIIQPIADKEILRNQNEIFKYKVRLISDVCASAGNLLKFIIPPTSGSWTALNLPEWEELIYDALICAKYSSRDKTLEKVVYNRIVIDENWKKLLEVN